MIPNGKVVQDDGTFIERNRGSLLLPRFGVLGLLSAVPVMIGSLLGATGRILGGVFLSAAMLVTIVYLAWLTLRTLELVKSHQSLNRLDTLICRYSGPFAWALGFALLTFALATGSAAESSGIEPIFLRSRSVLQIVHFVTEVGFVFAVTCVWTPRSLGHARPLPLWKVSCVPLLVIYGLYVTLIPVGIVASVVGLE